MAPQKKIKKSAESINSRLALVMKSGKYTLGYKSTLKTLRSGKSKLVIICNNCPPLRKSEIEYYAMLAKTHVHHYNGSEFPSPCTHHQLSPAPLPLKKIPAFQWPGHIVARAGATHKAWRGGWQLEAPDRQRQVAEILQEGTEQHSLLDGPGLDRPSGLSCQKGGGGGGGGLSGQAALTMGRSFKGGDGYRKRMSDAWRKSRKTRGATLFAQVEAAVDANSSRRH